jgi:predicted nuclease of predicted toxin-antitoxin system
MRVKLDENIPVRLAGELSTVGHDVDTVASEGLKGKPDSDVWSAARREERFLITQAGFLGCAPVQARNACWTSPRAAS